MPETRLSLNQWRERLANTYFITQNIEKDSYKIFSHLVEVVGGLSKYTLKLEDYGRSQEFLAKVLAWYLSLVTNLEFTDISDMVWKKFPKRCPYCRREICLCHRAIRKPKLDIEELNRLSTNSYREMPRDLFEWQIMFDRIYHHTESLEAIRSRQKRKVTAQRHMHKYFGHLVEELAEASESIRLRHFYPDNIRNELPDIFAWIMAIANVLGPYFGQRSPVFVGRLMNKTYLEGCPSCEESICICRPGPVREAISSAGIYEDTALDTATGFRKRSAFNKILRDLSAGPESDKQISMTGIGICSSARTPSKLRKRSPRWTSFLRNLAQIVRRATSGDDSIFRLEDFFVVLSVDKPLPEVRRTSRRLMTLLSSDVHHSNARPPLPSSNFAIVAGNCPSSAPTVSALIETIEGKLRTAVRSHKSRLEFLSGKDNSTAHSGN